MNKKVCILCAEYLENRGLLFNHKKIEDAGYCEVCKKYHTPRFKIADIKPIDLYAAQTQALIRARPQGFKRVDHIAYRNQYCESVLDREKMLSSPSGWQRVRSQMFQAYRHALEFCPGCRGLTESFFAD